MHVSILAKEDAVKGSATRAAMLKESIFYHVMTFGVGFITGL